MLSKVFMLILFCLPIRQLSVQCMRNLVNGQAVTYECSSFSTALVQSRPASGPQPSGTLRACPALYWDCFYLPALCTMSSSSIGTATLVGYGLLNYRWVFSAGRLLHSAVASGTSNPQLGGPVIRTFQLPQPDVPHVWNDAIEPQQLKLELWARNSREFCRKWRLPRRFWVLLHVVNLRHGTDGFNSPQKEGVLRIFSPEKSDGFGRVWTREIGYSTLTCRPPKPLLYHCST